MKNKIQNFWNKQAKTYDKSERQFDPVFQKILADTEKYLDENDKALDFGCATGTKTLKLAKFVKHIHGLDLSDEMINIAVKKTNDSGIKNASFSQGNIFSDDLEKESFDKIISYGLIHLLKDSEKDIRRVHDLLKPGGLFITSVACLKDKMDIKNKFKFSVFMLIKRLGMFPLHLNMFRTGDVEQLIANQKFHLVHTEVIFSGMTISSVVAKKM